MNKVLLQIWELSERSRESFRDGCSVHIDDTHLSSFVGDVYGKRVKYSVPQEYSRVVGSPVVVFVDDAIYEKVLKLGSVRLPETSLSNLLSIGDIIVKC